MTPALAAALGVALLLIGGLLAVVGLVGTRGPAGPDSAFGAALGRLIGAGLSPGARRRRQTLLAAAAVVGALGWLASGLPIVGIALLAAVVALPWLFGAGRAEQRMIDRLDAIETWTRRLSDLVRSGSGLHQAIIVSAQDPPAAIETEVRELATELRGEVSTTEALRRFADRLADASSDEVIAAVILNARERGPRLADVLDRVSESMADLVTMRREVASGRTDARISGQILSGLTLAGLAVLALNRTYMQPYHTALGQIVLAVVMVMFGGLLVWCRQLNQPQRIPRLLLGSRAGEREAR